MSYVSVREQRLIAALRGIQKSAPGGDPIRQSHERRKAKRPRVGHGPSPTELLKSGINRGHRNEVRVTEANHHYLVEKFLDFSAQHGSALGFDPEKNTFDHLDAEARSAIGIIYCEWLLQNKISTFGSVEKYVRGLRLHHERNYRPNPLQLSEVYDFKRYFSNMDRDIQLVGTPQSMKAMLPFHLFLVFVYSWDITDPMQAQLAAVSLLVLFNGLRMGDLLPDRSSDWNHVWYLTIKLYDPWSRGALLSLPKTKNRPRGPPLYIFSPVNTWDTDACCHTALNRHFGNLISLNGPQHGDLPLFRQWDSSAQRFKPEALSVCDIRALFSTRLKTLFPSLPVIGVHTYRICSNNLMIAANVPLATRMWFHNWGQAKASALSEVIYRRLLQNDIQYHQAIIARTLFTFVTAAKRHIAA
jgi:hypothetical protein